MVKVNRNVMVMGAGAGVGVVQTVLTKQYIDPMFGPIPIIGDYLPYPWGNWSSLGNILIGGTVFGLAQFTKVFKGKKADIGNFLTIYGITTLIGGLMNGIFPAPGTGLRARAPARLAARLPARTVAPYTPTGIPSTRIIA